MKQIIILLVLTIPTLVFAQKPSNTRRFQPKMSMSLLYGKQKNIGITGDVPMYGVQISFQCPMIHSPKFSVSQNIRIIHQEDEKLQSTALEMNPQYNFINNSSFRLGAGPSAGLLFANASGERKTKFSYGLGTASVVYIKNMSVGIGVSYTMTGKDSFQSYDNESATISSLNNVKAFVSLGFKL